MEERRRANAVTEKKIETLYSVTPYAIRRAALKTGISGQPLNKNGTSPRANSQVNAFNKADDGYEYYAEVVVTDIPGRREALKWEQQSANELAAGNNSLSKHKLPKPEVEN